MTPSRVFLTLTVTRWFPVGLYVGIMTLWALERGLSLPAAVSAMALIGWVVFVLELPTSGFADAFGRKPVYLVAAVVGVAASVTFLVADSFATFAIASALMGVFRALDSGPLEAWFVDEVHRSEPDADVSRPLALQSTVLGLSIAAGSLLSAGLVAWHPLPDRSALFLPFLVSAVLAVVHVVAVLALLDETRDTDGAGRALDSVREAPVIVREGLGLLRANRVLLALVLVEAF